MVSLALVPARAADLSSLDGPAHEFIRSLEEQKLPDSDANSDPDSLLADLDDMIKAGQWPDVLSTAQRLIHQQDEEYIVIDGLAQAEEHLGKDLETVYAAYIASLTADTNQQRGAQMLRVARHLEKLQRLNEAFSAYQLAAAQTSDPLAAAGVSRLSSQIAFDVVADKTNASGDLASQCIQFDRPLRSTSQLRYEDYVRIEPTTQLSYRVNDDTLCLDGLSYGTTYKVTLLKGMPGGLGGHLDADKALELAIGDRDPSVGFRNQAYVLPRIGSTGVPIYTVNVQHVKLQLLRINDRNLIGELNDRRFLTNLYEYDGKRIAEERGEEVWHGVMDIDVAKNVRQATSVPISDLVKRPEPGIYILMARPLRPNESTSEASNPDNQDESAGYYDAYATQWLVVSDLGLTTLSGQDGLSVFVRSLAGATPIDRVEVRLLARNNEVLAKALTDRSGFAHFDPGLLRGEGGRTATSIMAFRNKDGDFSFLDLTRAAYDLSDRGVSGRQAPADADVFFYTDRGVYRPGETVHLMALLRDPSANAIDDLPISLRLKRPDGTEAARFDNLKGQGGGFSQDLALATTSRTGSWTVEAYTDPKGTPVATTTFLVEDVVPARIEVDTKANADALSEDRATTLDVAAKFLYGAPAANLVTKADMVIARDPNPFPNAAGYEFGLADEEISPKRVDIADTRTDDGGKASLPITVQGLPDVQSPLAATIRTEVYEFGGRPVLKSVTLPIRRAGVTLGIKPAFNDHEIPENSEASFEIIALDQQGQTLARPKLQYRLIQEDWDYNWFYSSGNWDYTVAVHDGAVKSGEFDVPADKSGSIKETVNWGNYRLEVFDPASGNAVSVRFHAGWSAKPGTADTPDKLAVTADKPLYQAGDKAEVMIRPPFDGEVLLTVATDRVLESRIVSVPQAGKIVKIAVDPSWGAGAYVLASAFRPGERAEHGPGRAIGLTWLGIDPKPRQLQISMTVPDKVAPQQHIEIPVQVKNAGAGTVMLTLAAVDEGILQLTDFTTPDPLGYYFGKRRLGVELRDLYGQLIDGKAGRRGQIREGGDGDNTQRGAPPEIKLVALFSGPVTVGKDGTAKVGFDIPDYNGRLRLMAIAYDDKNVGAAEAGLVVHDPIIAEVSVPRFLAPGDKSMLSLSLRDIDAPDGSYDVALQAADDVQLGKGASFTADLKAGQTLDRRIPMLGNRVGAGHMTLTISGPNGLKLSHEITVPVRPAQLPITESQVSSLNPGERLDVASNALDKFLPGTGLLRASFTTAPNLDVQSVLKDLEHYPYGCLEQTASIAFPLLFTSDIAAAWGLDDRYQKIDPQQVQYAIVRILDHQRFDGQFSLWNSAGSAEPWLSAYAMDFLTRAKAKGFKVPGEAYTNGLAGLQHLVRGELGDSHLRYAINLDAKTYALYVLTVAQQSSLSDLRYMYDTYKQDLSSLPLAQISAALGISGDQARALEGFKLAIDRVGKRDEVWWDYGSPLRDLAAVITLATESQVAGLLPPDQAPAKLLERLAALQNGQRYFSTQEQAWLLQAASATTGKSSEFALDVDGVGAVKQDKAYVKALDAAGLQKGFGATNAGQHIVYARATYTGIPTADVPLEDNGYDISRTYYTPSGDPADLKSLKQNDLLIVVINGKIKDEANHQSLIVDLLPAGLEIENARLSDRRQTADYSWLPELTPADYEEFRDDRYVAAIDRNASGFDNSARDFTFAYLVRVVSPGTYKVPAVSIEDMYKPQYRASGKTDQMVIMAP
jgi:hypothetical protein